MDPQHENAYETVKNPVYGINDVARGDTTSSSVMSDSKMPYNRSNKVTIALIVATCFSILLAVCSLAVAIFVLLNQHTPNTAQMQQLQEDAALSTNSDAMQEQLSTLSKELNTTKSVLAQELNTTNSQYRALSEDLAITQSQIAILSQNVNVARTRIIDFEKDANVTQSQVQMLSKDVSGLASSQSAINEIVIEINKTMDEVVVGPPG